MMWKETTKTIVFHLHCGASWLLKLYLINALAWLLTYLLNRDIVPSSTKTYYQRFCYSAYILRYSLRWRWHAVTHIRGGRVLPVVHHSIAGDAMCTASCVVRRLPTINSGGLERHSGCCRWRPRHDSLPTQMSPSPRRRLYTMVPVFGLLKWTVRYLLTEKEFWMWWRVSV